MNMTLIDSLFTKGVKPSRRDICAINIRDKKKKKNGISIIKPNV